MRKSSIVLKISPHFGLVIKLWQANIINRPGLRPKFESHEVTLNNKYGSSNNKSVACESNGQDLRACRVAEAGTWTRNTVYPPQTPHFLLPFVDKFVFEWVSWVPFHDITLCWFIGERYSWDLQKRWRARSIYTLQEWWAWMMATALLMPQGEAKGLPLYCLQGYLSYKLLNLAFF